MKTIRCNTFETNSSSSHSVTIHKGCALSLEPLIKDKTLNVNVLVDPEYGHTLYTDNSDIIILGDTLEKKLGLVFLHAFEMVYTPSSMVWMFVNHHSGGYKSDFLRELAEVYLNELKEISRLMLGLTVFKCDNYIQVFEVPSYLDSWTRPTDEAAKDAAKRVMSDIVFKSDVRMIDVISSN